MSLQLIGISAGIAAQTALERTFSGVGANVPLQLANLKCVKAQLNSGTIEGIKKGMHFSRKSNCDAISLYIPTSTLA